MVDTHMGMERVREGGEMKEGGTNSRQQPPFGMCEHNVLPMQTEGGRGHMSSTYPLFLCLLLTFSEVVRYFH